MSKAVRTDVHNGYTYTTYDTGTVTAKGKTVDIKEPRSPSAQKNAGGDSKLSTDHGGHLVPASQGGMKDGANISAQDSKVNTRDVRAVERQETAAVRNGMEISTERTSYCGNDPNRPDAYMINDTVTKSDGSTYNVHHSFTNTDMSRYNENYEGLENAPDSYEAAKDTGLSRDDFYQTLEEAENMNVGDYGNEWVGSSNEISQGDVPDTDTSDFGLSDDGGASGGDDMSDTDGDSSSDSDGSSDDM